MDNEQELWSRRKVLGTLGLTGVATLAGTTTQAAPKVEQNEIHTYRVLSDLVNDRKVPSGATVQTLGYYQPGDEGNATYQVSKAKEVEKEDVSIIPLQHGLVATLLNAKAVNYKMFGVVGDGVNDDGDQIRQAHTYANWKGVPVVNMSGEFWLMEGQEIPIQTNVYLGQTIFHINEKRNTSNRSYFAVKSRHKAKPIDWSADVKARFVKALKPGLQIFTELEPYRNCMIIVEDEKDRLGFRAGARYNGTSWSREDFFYVEEHGRVIGDIAWAFNDYTSLVAYPAEDHYLEIDGGTFYISGDIPGGTYEGYKRCGFSVSRSRTIIKNQWVGLEPGKKDISMNPRSGFYTFTRAYDILLENVRVIPWEQDREGTDRDVAAGTYGISIVRVMKATFRNVIAEGGRVHWGVFGNNLIKDLFIDNCQFNRVDVHFHGWNIHIKDSKIGYRGITVTGGGELLIENTSCANRFFVSFRRDYGAKWDGNVTIRNCRYYPAPGKFHSLLYFHPADFEYGYPIGMAHSIVVENMIIDYKNHPDIEEDCWLIQTPDFAISKGGKRQYFPRQIVMKNISVTGRQKGVRLLKLHDPSYYQVTKNGKVSDYQLDTNATLIFEDIDLEEINDQSEVPKEVNHFFIVHEKDADYQVDSLYPAVFINRCNGFKGMLGNLVAASVDIKHSTIRQLACSDDSKLQGKLTFWDCTFAPISSVLPNTPFFKLDSALGTSFINCRVHAPLVNGQAATDQLNFLGFIEMNRSLRYNHINTLLGGEILAAYKGEKNGIQKSFISMLKNHYEVD